MFDWLTLSYFIWVFSFYGEIYAVQVSWIVPSLPLLPRSPLKTRTEGLTNIQNEILIYRIDAILTSPFSFSIQWGSFQFLSFVPGLHSRFPSGPIQNKHNPQVSQPHPPHQPSHSLQQALRKEVHFCSPKAMRFGSHFW